MGMYETQEAFVDPQLLAGSQSDLPPEQWQHSQHEEAPSARQDVAATNLPRFWCMFHAFGELFSESERFLSAVRSKSGGAEQHSKPLEDVLRNQQQLLTDYEEQRKHVWVQVNLDATGCVHFGRLMRTETTMQALYKQLPPLFGQVLNSMPLHATHHFRLLPQSISSSSKPFDLECDSNVSLRDVMEEYLPGTYDFKFQILHNKEPIDFAQELIPKSTQQQQHAPQPPEEFDHVQKLKTATASSLPPMPTHTQCPAVPPASLAHMPAAVPQQFEDNLDDLAALGLKDWDRLAAQYCHRQASSPMPPGSKPTPPRPSALHTSRKPPAISPNANAQKRAQKHVAWARNEPLQDERLQPRGVDELQEFSFGGSAGGFGGLSGAHDSFAGGSRGGARQHPVRSDAENVAGNCGGASTSDEFAGAAPEVTPGSRRAKKRQRVASHPSPQSPTRDELAGPLTDRRPGGGSGSKRGEAKGGRPGALADLVDVASPEARNGNGNARPRLPASLAKTPVGPPGQSTPTRSQWKIEDVTVLLKGIQEYGTQWSMIMLIHFPHMRGTNSQNKIKDKWRVLCKGVKNRHTSRSNLPAHLWDRVEELSKLYGIN